MIGAPMLRKMISRGIDMWFSEELEPHQIEAAKRANHQACTEAVAWDIQNVVDYLDGLGRQKRYDIALADLPCVLAPLPMMWFEFDPPRSQDWALEKIFSNSQRVGVLVRTYDLLDRERHPDDGIPRWIPFRANGPLARFAFDMLVYLDLLSPVEPGIPTTVTGPQLQLTSVLDDQGGWSCHHDGRARLQTGGISPNWVDWQRLIQGELGDEKAGKAQAYISREFALPVLFSISLTHCRNVSVVENDGLYISRQERRRAERRGDPPALKFYTLEIGAITRALREEGGAEKTGLKRALHICRGHFATYTEEKPLFGKYAGRFWVPAHVRGTTEAGQVIKDYSVKAPKEQAA